MTIPHDGTSLLVVFFPLGADQADAYIEQARERGWIFVEAVSGWAMHEGRLCYGHWYRFTPVQNRT